MPGIWCSTAGLWGMLWSLWGGVGGGEQGKWNQDETGINQRHARQRFLLPGLL